jgi:cystathionine beta-lyase/cystathionine gamma-synthase
VSVASAARRHQPSATAGLLACALADLEADFGELLLLCDGGQAKLAALDADLADACLSARTRELLGRGVAASRRRYRAIAARIRSLHPDRSTCTRSLVDELTAEKAALADLLRTEQALLAALLSAPDWQSPSYLHSDVPAAGRQAGRVRAHWNDYKRDRHLDAEAYEREYVEALVDGPAQLRALLTSCGMSAFTTIASFLLLERKLAGPVIAGAGLYHETRLLLERALPGRIRFVEERTLRDAIDESRPSAVFLDSLSNTAWMPVPELDDVIERLRGTDTYLIVDNTGLSVACQPFALAGGSVRLVMFESLLKYAQLGLDRANAGIIVTRSDIAAVLDEYREHLGTNIADVAVHALPRPDRQVLDRRLARLQRNALFLAERLSERAPAGVAIVYPGLPSHPCANVAARLPFRGGCLSIVLRERDRRLVRERRLVEAAVAEAAKRGVRLLAGSSFGFDTTRIYLAAGRADCGSPFVRISAGTEHQLALEPLAEVLADVVESLDR